MTDKEKLMRAKIEVNTICPSCKHDFKIVEEVFSDDTSKAEIKEN